jgi:6-phosphogluconolactonase
MEASVNRRIEIFETADELSRRGAELFMSEATAAIVRQGKFSVAFSGGSTPRPLFQMLATDEYLTRAEWKGIHFFWADERCVPPDHPDCNFKLAFDLLLSKLPLTDTTHFHRITGEMPPDLAALAYERTLRDFFTGQPLPSFDLIILGVGVDGHTASIFPEERSVDNVSRYAVAVYVEKLASYRVTLTLPVINNARKVVFLVTGKEKANIVRNIIVDDNPQYPAAMVKPTGDTITWLLDRGAASALTG